MSCDVEPDPSSRPGVERGALLFSKRCALNAIETGMRVLGDGPVAPRELFDTKTKTIILVEQGRK